MKHIKVFENYFSCQFKIQDELDDLKVEIEFPEDAVVIPVSEYDIDVIEYFKEIFLGKMVKFQCIDRLRGNPWVEGVIEDVDQLLYQDEFFIRVKVSKTKDDREWHEKSVEFELSFLKNWYLMANYSPVIVYDYDVDNKPLHKELELKKEAEKYNL